MDEIGEIDDVDRFAVDRPRVTGNPLTDVTEIMGVEYPGAAETGARLDGEVDAISRGIISLDDAQMLFDLYVDLLSSSRCFIQAHKSRDIASFKKFSLGLRLSV